MQLNLIALTALQPLYSFTDMQHRAAIIYSIRLSLLVGHSWGTAYAAAEGRGMIPPPENF